MREALLRKFASSRVLTQDKQRRQSNGGTQVVDWRPNRGGFVGKVLYLGTSVLCRVGLLLGR